MSETFKIKQSFTELEVCCDQKYCKTLYFRCILISQFWCVNISLHDFILLVKFAKNDAHKNVFFTVFQHLGN